MNQTTQSSSSLKPESLQSQTIKIETLSDIDPDDVMEISPPPKPMTSTSDTITIYVDSDSDSEHEPDPGYIHYRNRTMRMILDECDPNESFFSNYHHLIEPYEKKPLPSYLLSPLQSPDEDHYEEYRPKNCFGDYCDPIEYCKDEPESNAICCYCCKPITNEKSLFVAWCNHKYHQVCFIKHIRFSEAKSCIMCKSKKRPY